MCEKAALEPWDLVDDHISLLGMLALNIPVLALSLVPLCIAGSTAAATLASPFTCKYAPV